MDNNINEYINTEMDSFNKTQQEPQPDDTLNFDYRQSAGNDSIIKVIGVGGGGMNAVAHMFNEGIKDVSFLTINTDRQALQHSPITNRLQIGPGLGAGAKPEVARQYAEESREAIASALKDGTQMVFITAGMGGGTGTGAGPVVASVAQELGILTVGIITIPFQFEGKDKIRMALDGVEEMRKHVDALLVVNNDRLPQIYPDLDFSNAFAKADDTLAIAAKSISDIINRPGYVNLDFADVTTTLKDSGVALISTGEAEGEGRVTQSINQAVASPLLLDNDISRAKHLLFEICFSHQHPVTMKEIAELNDFIAHINPNIKVIWGAMFDDSLGEKVRMIILSSGFDVDSIVPEHAKPAAAPAAPAPETPETPETPKTPESPETPEIPETPESPESPESPETPETPETQVPQPPVQAPVQIAPAASTEDAIERIRRYYGDKTADEIRMETVRQNYVVLDNDDLTNDELIAILEKLPAYNRSAGDLSQIQAARQNRNTPRPDNNGGNQPDDTIHFN